MKRVFIDMIRRDLVPHPSSFNFMVSPRIDQPKVAQPDALGPLIAAWLRRIPPWRLSLRKIAMQAEIAGKMKEGTFEMTGSGREISIQAIPTEMTMRAEARDCGALGHRP